jgi:hypothetical protein
MTSRDAAAHDTTFSALIMIEKTPTVKTELFASLSHTLCKLTSDLVRTAPGAFVLSFW